MLIIFFIASKIISVYWSLVDHEIEVRKATPAISNSVPRISRKQAR